MSRICSTCPCCIAPLIWDASSSKLWENWSLRGALVTTHLQTLCHTGSVFLPFLVPCFELEYWRKLRLPFKNTCLLPSVSLLYTEKGEKGNSYIKLQPRAAKGLNQLLLQHWVMPWQFSGDDCIPSIFSLTEHCHSREPVASPAVRVHHTIWDISARPSWQAPHLQRELLGNLRHIGSPSLLLVQWHHHEVLKQLPLLILDQVPFQGLVPRGLLQARFHMHQALAVSYQEKD